MKEFRHDLDRALDRWGLGPEMVAVAMIVVGVLVLVFPQLVAWILGLSLVALGVFRFLALLEARRPRPSEPDTAAKT